MNDLPGYVLSSAIVINLKGARNRPEIVLGTSAGNLHILSSQGVPLHSFSAHVGAINLKVRNMLLLYLIIVAIEN